MKNYTTVERKSERELVVTRTFNRPARLRPNRRGEHSHPEISREEACTHRRLHVWLTIASLLVPTTLYANTWDEPWHKEVVVKADTLGLYHVESLDGNAAKVTLKKHLAGSPTPEQLDLADYFLFRVTSSSSNEWKPWLKPGADYYLYLKQASPGHWELPTPSAGSDVISFSTCPFSFSGRPLKKISPSG
jgi:hypothetical protein